MMHSSTIYSFGAIIFRRIAPLVSLKQHGLKIQMKFWKDQGKRYYPAQKKNNLKFLLQQNFT